MNLTDQNFETEVKIPKAYVITALIINNDSYSLKLNSNIGSIEK